MHNQSSYEHKSIILDEVMIDIELWGVLAGKMLEGTAFYTADNKQRLLRFIREVEVKEHRADTLMK